MNQELLDCLDDIHAKADAVARDDDGPSNAGDIHLYASRAQEILVEQERKLKDAEAVLDAVFRLVESPHPSDADKASVLKGLRLVSRMLRAYRDDGNVTRSVTQTEEPRVHREVAGSIPV